MYISVFLLLNESSGFIKRTPPKGRKFEPLYKHKPAAASTLTPKVESNWGNMSISLFIKKFSYPSPNKFISHYSLIKFSCPDNWTFTCSTLMNLLNSLQVSSIRLIIFSKVLLSTKFIVFRFE